MSPQVPNNAVTGNEDAEFQNFLRQAIQEEIQKSHQPAGADNQNFQPQQAVTPQPIALDINGQRLQFANPEELSRSIQGMVNEFNQRLSAQPQAPAPQNNQVSGQDEPQFDLNRFVEKMTTNPVDAFNYVDEYRFKGQNPYEKAIKAADDVETIKKSLAAYQFRDAHPEFQGNPRNASILQGIMQQAGLPQDVNGLEAAYSLAVVRGLMPPPPHLSAAQPQQPAQQAQDIYGQNPWGAVPNQYQNFQGANFQGPDPRSFNGGANFAPPRVPRTGVTDPVPDLSSMAEDLSADELARVINQSFSRLQR